MQLQHRVSSAANHRACVACASISGGLGFVVIRLDMDNQPPANHAGSTVRNRNHVHLDTKRGPAACIGLECGQITSMALGAAMVCVCLAMRIEVSTSAHPVAGTAITLLMDVETMLLAWRKTGDGSRDLHSRTALGKRDGTCGGMAFGRLQSCHRRRAASRCSCASGQYA